MNHDKYKELLQFSVYDEISEREKLDLENHLLECSECADELRSIKKLYSALAVNRPAAVSESLLVESRRELFNNIRAEANKPTLAQRVNEFIDSIIYSRYKLAFSGVATLSLGLLLGYFLFTNMPAGDGFNDGQSINVDQLIKDNVQISNISFNQIATDEGQLEFVFNATKPVKYSGSINDKFTQQLLATALLTADNPGVRLKSVNTIAMQSSESFIPDNKVKNTLIASLKTDDNPGVRRAAINTLIRFPLDTDIRDAFLYVLTSDDNAAIRIAAINGLSKLKESGTSIDDNMRTILQDRVQTDENKFIKVRAASLLEEVK